MRIKLPTLLVLIIACAAQLGCEPLRMQIGKKSPAPPSLKDQLEIRRQRLVRQAEAERLQNEGQADTPPLTGSNQVDPNASANESTPPTTIGRDGRIIRSRDEWSSAEIAAESLGRIGEPAVPALVQLLEHPDTATRQMATEVLARMGDRAATAVPALTERLRDVDPGVRRSAVRALGQIGPKAADAVPALIDFLRLEDNGSPAAPNATDNPAP
ncbi:MAG: HEAT repeat domain-containing protein [Planctomycetales bacterium]|nr:HEAT repeat domain-containing protein [Planctomycetales bacterium]